MIDNYDSFTFNLVQYFGEIYNKEIKIFRNDVITVSDLAGLKPHGIIISPGPCTPKEAGISVEVIQKLGSQIPLFGVCLGHQSIGHAFGGNVIRAPYLMHGKVSKIFHDERNIYKGIPSPFTATRYHSLIIEKKSCPDVLKITSETDDGLIMGVEHKEYPIYGVQFHPEAILTEYGKVLLKNFVDMADRFWGK